MMEAVIVDSGGANLASLRYALERQGARTHVSRDAATIASAARVVLPGVGAAAHAMERLHAAGLTGVLRALTQPVLGVCLGMQLLFALSEEGRTECLGLLPYAVRRLSSAPGRPVPHMGWNQLCRLRPDPLLEGVPEGAWAYFVHSYAAPLTEHTLASAEYGAAVSAVVRRGNFWGTQFHPERSAATGARVLENFLRL
jgi:imidazole glycerol-phosphate synthase subunit HisH